ncbi:MAG: GIY-YIG nuclease family protein, partial [Gammaproteobacteria bacterium SHHR-1]
MWYVYVLRSAKNKTLYIGSTNNIKRRVKEHKTGLCISTKANRPWKIETIIVLPKERQARTLEKYFKTGSG